MKNTTNRAPEQAMCHGEHGREELSWPFSPSNPIFWQLPRASARDCLGRTKRPGQAALDQIDAVRALLEATPERAFADLLRVVGFPAPDDSAPVPSLTEDVTRVT